MIICHTVEEFKTNIEKLNIPNGKIGFVPTMGALHNGHLSLIQKSASENEITVCSIFVNPIQFNNKEDLLKYPRTPEKDIALIENDCQLLFMPSVEEIYPEKVSESYDFGPLENVMEGAFRPGHFNGVAVVVSRLFDIVKPNKAYFGEKDYQQLQLIKAMTQKLQLPIDVVACEIIRESDGLAMSSRNARLSSDNRKLAPLIYKNMLLAKENLKFLNFDQVLQLFQKELEKQPHFKIEYIEIADETSLQPVRENNLNKKVRLFIAVWVGDVRLIDNLALN